MKVRSGSKVTPRILGFLLMGTGLLYMEMGIMRYMPYLPCVWEINVLMKKISRYVRDDDPGV